jgi:tRNA-splicing ligase RtcB
VHKIDDKIVAFIDPSDIEPQALQQLRNVAALPFIFKHVAVMPDVHLGMGATIGSVIATQGAVVPAAVGVDIGCGMIAVKTPFKSHHLPDNLESLRHQITRSIPLSAGRYNRELTVSALQRVHELELFAGDHVAGMTKTHWAYHLGTLGSGNHFIEVCLDENDFTWLVLHSGSRGIGNRLAQVHIKVARKIMDEMFISLPDKDLAYLPESRPEFQAYIDDLMWAQAFALANREEMMDRVISDFAEALGVPANFVEDKRINCHHNFTQYEHHMGQDVLVTRKGAIQMKRGMQGVIPGSMGTRTYIVEGLENPMAFHSAPHGAGRRFSRKEARRRFTMDDFDRELEGVEVKRHSDFIDEIPSAYKRIEDVIENSGELVMVTDVLKQILNVKGS